MHPAVLFAVAFAPFSHKQHAPLRLDCAYCHVTANTGEQAGYPTAKICKNCHPAMARPASQIVEPELSVYALAEFAKFSHARHHAARIECQTCHGNVWEMQVVRQVLPMTMKACVACHRANHATTACKKCHDLEGQ